MKNPSNYMEEARTRTQRTWTQTYQMRINTIHAMIWLCRDDTKLPDLKRTLEELMRIQKEREYPSLKMTEEY